MRLSVLARRQARGLLLLGAVLVIMSSLPVRPANAFSKFLAINNTLNEFANGKFQRTSLSSLQVPADTQDVAGAVQLLPVGVLKPWEPLAFSLPKKLTNLNAVAIGTHIFVIGGITGSGTTRKPTADVWSATIDPTTGAPTLQVGATYWYTETKLPAIDVAEKAPPETGTYLLAERSSAAVTTVQTGPDSGYIYVIGGSIQPDPLTTLSSYGVSIATVSAGHITGWATGPKIPSTVFGAVGLSYASAVSFKAANNKTYVYLIGGLQRFIDAGVAHEAGSRQVYYAEFGSGGQLVKPSGGAGTDPVWATLTQIPLRPAGLTGEAGLWDATAVADRIVVGNSSGGDTTGDELYVMGGQYQSSVNPNTGVDDVYSADVYRAVFQSNGAITWQQDTPAPTLPQTLGGFSGVQFGGALYLAGGQPPGTSSQPTRAVLSTYIEDDFTLARLGQGSNFQSSDNTLPAARAGHATVVVRATPTAQSPNPAYIYVIAGRGSTSTDLDGSDTLFMGRVGANTDTETPAFAKEGWFYSQVYDIVFNGATVQEISWSTVITAPAGILLQYRVSTDSDCSNPVGLPATWSPQPGFTSLNGTNVKSLGTPPPARCFQFRAKLSNGQAGLLTSPSLLRVSIRVNIPGFPDLKVLKLEQRRDAQQHFVGLNVQIQNHNTVEDTQPADAEAGGSFFVDMFIFGPGQTPVVPTIPFTGTPAGDKACADIAKGQMNKDAVLTITQWYTATDPTCHSTSQDILTLFKNPGHYVVYVAVDSTCPPSSYGCVREGSTGGESNNLSQKLDIDIKAGDIRYERQIPFVSRGPAP
jgi:hypothetical protein